MIQRAVPDQFDWPAWHAMVSDGMCPSARDAHVVLTTTAATAYEVMDEYQIPSPQMRVVPLAHDPVRRFATLPIERVTKVREPFVLNVANHASHKGAEVLLRAVGLWKQQPEWQGWMLAICGFGTGLFSPESVEEYQGKHVPQMRQLARDLGLVEGRDVVFLDYIDDQQLKDLFQRSSIVVNAARYDNGSFSMIEGTWFGKPVVSSRYPGAEYLDRRFGVGAHFFGVQDPVDLLKCVGCGKEKFGHAGRGTRCPSSTCRSRRSWITTVWRASLRHSIAFGERRRSHTAVRRIADADQQGGLTFAKPISGDPLQALCPTLLVGRCASPGFLTIRP